MNDDTQCLPARTQDLEGPSAAVSDDATPADDPALRFETHWSRILHHDLFAPARHDSDGGGDDSANDD